MQSNSLTLGRQR